MSQEMTANAHPRTGGKSCMKTIKVYSAKLDEEFDSIAPRAEEIRLEEHFSENFMKQHSVFENKYAKQTLQNAIVQFPKEKLVQSMPVAIWCLENMIRLSKNIRTKKNYKKE